MSQARKILNLVLASTLLFVGGCALRSSEPQSFSQWAGRAAIPVRSLTADDYSDLRFLRSTIGNARVVMLGESAHNVREYNLARARMTRFLIDEMGFKVVAFESPMFECGLGNRALRDGNPEGAMGICFWPMGRTPENLEFLRYLQTRPDVSIAGFDNQTFSTRDHRKNFLRTLVGPFGADYAGEVDRMEDRFWDARTGNDWLAKLRAEGPSLAAGYSRLAVFLRAKAAEAREPALRRNLSFGAQVAYANQRLVTGMTDPDSNVGYRTRDETMAENLRFLARELYPKQKIVVWAHNAHIHRANETISYGDVGAMGTGVPAMGGFFATYAIPTYSIGLFARRGEMHLVDKKPYAVSPLVANSLESVAPPGGAPAVFYPLSKRRSAPSLPVLVKHWGNAHHPIVLRDQFDGVLVIDEVKGPDYIKVEKVKPETLPLP